MLAYIAVSKYADGLPLYRQEAIYLRDSVVLSRSLMAQWMGHLGFELRILSDYILERIKASERIFADETTLPTLVPGSGKTMKAWLWAYACDDRPFGGSGPPMVAYRFEDSRGAQLRGASSRAGSVAFCKLTGTRPIPAWSKSAPSPAAMKGSSWPDAGLTYAASFMSCTSVASMTLRQLRSPR